MSARMRNVKKSRKKMVRSTDPPPSCTAAIQLVNEKSAITAKTISMRFAIAFLVSMNIETSSLRVAESSAPFFML